MDIGSAEHHVIIGLSGGEILSEFKLLHSSTDIRNFLDRIEQFQKKYDLPVAVAMEAYNGYARPIDKYIQNEGYRLLNVNNHKLAQFKKIFPGPAKNDSIDTKKIFELFTLSDRLPLAKTVLQEVARVPVINEKLKCLTRRRRSIVHERIRLSNRFQSDVQAVCPGLLNITGNANNTWFLHFLTAGDDIEKLSRLKPKSLLKIKGIGCKYLTAIQEWQKEKALFSPDVEWTGPMILRDAKRLLALNAETQALDTQIESYLQESAIGIRLKSIPGFGVICSAELAGEIGDINRFKSEASLALYFGMAVLDNSSGKYQGSKNSKHVNKRIKAAMMISAARHIEQTPEAKCFYDKKRKEGKRHNQAVRALGRHLVRVIWKMLTNNRDYTIRSIDKKND